MLAGNSKFGFPLDNPRRLRCRDSFEFLREREEESTEKPTAIIEGEVAASDKASSIAEAPNSREIRRAFHQMATNSNPP